MGIGLIDEAEVWRHRGLHTAHRFLLKIDVLYGTTPYSVMKPYPEMLQLLDELRRRGFTIGLLSIRYLSLGV